MTIYIVYMLLISIEGVLLSASQLRNKRKIFLFLAFIQLFVFTGLRGYNIGSDTLRYLEFLPRYVKVSPLKILTEGDPVNDFEIGYALLNVFFSRFSVDYTAFLFFIALISYFPVFKVIEKYSYYPLISIFTYFAFGLFYYSLGLFRQMIALSICICALPFLLNEKGYKRNHIFYFLTVILASLFHTTAICWLLIWVVKNIDLKKIRHFVLPISLVCLPAGGFVAGLLVRIFPRYESYVGTMREEGGGSFLILLLFFAIYFMVIALVSLDELTELEKISLWGLILAILAQSIAYSFGLIGRAVVYFSFFLIILIPTLIRKIKLLKQPILCALAWFVLLAITVLTQFYENEYICPFYFFWEK